MTEKEKPEDFDPVKMKSIQIIKNIGCREIARELGIERQTVYNWRSGLVVPSIRSASMIADLFGVDLHDLLSRE